MTTAIPLTLHLLVLIGVYELAAGIAGLTGCIDWPKMLDEFERSPALTFFTGFAAFAVGAAINLAHHHFTDLLAIIVSAVGWIVLVEAWRSWPARSRCCASRVAWSATRKPSRFSPRCSALPSSCSA